MAYPDVEGLSYSNKIEVLKYYNGAYQTSDVEDAFTAVKNSIERESAEFSIEIVLMDFRELCKWLMAEGLVSRLNESSNRLAHTVFLWAEGPGFFYENRDEILDEMVRFHKA